MLVPKQEVRNLLATFGYKIRGVLHIGTHECEELGFYTSLGLPPSAIVWIDALQERVDLMRRKGVPNVYQAFIRDEDDSVVEISSLDPTNVTVPLCTSRLDTWVQREKISVHNLNYWNLDVRGAGLQILKGAIQSLAHPDVIYIEMATEEMLGAIDVFLEPQGFTCVRKKMDKHGCGQAIYIRKVIPKLSLCIPTMNRWSFLQTNLPKYLENPYIHEIVITDENGKDAAMISTVLKHHKIAVYTNEKRLGVFLNKQRAVSHAKHAWVCLLDSDNFAPLSYFDAWAAAQSACGPDPKVVYAPSRTLPSHGHAGFDFRHLAGQRVNAGNYKAFFKLPTAEICLNTMNYIVSKATYLQSNCCNGDNESSALDSLYRNYLLFHLSHATLFIVPGMEYDHVVHEGSNWVLNNATTHNEYFNGLFEEHPQFVMTLAQWQRTVKPKGELLYNCSEFHKRNDEWVRFPIGMNWTIINAGDPIMLQQGEHENLVLCSIADWTDERRRPAPPNRRSHLRMLDAKGIKNYALEHKTYFQALPHFKFIVSPEGNGVDCHRHYEALLAGSIPIVEEHPGIREKYVGCPVLFTKDYSEITPAYLEAKYAEMLHKTYDFSRLMMSAYDVKTQAEIKRNGDYWCKEHAKKVWYGAPSMPAIALEDQAFDVVVPLGPSDHRRLRIGLPLNRKNVVGCRNIYIVAPKSAHAGLKDLASSNIFLVDEARFPFDVADIATHFGETSRRGWYLQQLIKLYAGFIIHGILPKWLVIDADTMFLRPTRFLHEGRAAFNVAVENRKVYFEHMAKLHPSLHRADPRFSGIVHHMMFEAQHVKQLFTMVEAHHGSKPFWRAFFDCVVPEEYNGSGTSEYEIYFNFMILHNPSAIVLRPLSMANVHRIDTTLDVDYISAHQWMSHEGEGPVLVDRPSTVEDL